MVTQIKEIFFKIKADKDIVRLNRDRICSQYVVWRDQILFKLYIVAITATLTFSIYVNRSEIVFPNPFTKLHIFRTFSIAIINYTV